jgi:hypothetical protein
VQKFLALVLATLVLAACGGGGGGGSSIPPPPPPPTQVIQPPGPPNVEKIVVDQGPAGLQETAVNTAFVSVNVCEPGTNNCQLIDHIEVDTGSVGLRIIASVITQISLTPFASGPNAECLAFADGDSWGSLATADMELPISTEKASGITVHLIGAAAAGAPPATCQGIRTENTVADLGANGILGVGPFINDCNSGGNGNNGDCPPGKQSANYYICSAPGTCNATTASLAQQVPNPLTVLTDNANKQTDTNGVIMELPPVSGANQANPSGSLVFGIGTRGNNALTGTKLTADPTTGNITATLNGANFSTAYLDSGSNGNFFNDGTLSACPKPNDGFYCGGTPKDENAQVHGGAGVNLAASFTVDDANQMFSSNPTYTALPDLSGPGLDATTFDLGLAFFFGRNVFTGLEDVATNAQPYFAY